MLFMRFFFFIKSQTSCKSSTLLKLRAKQEEGFPQTAKGKKIHHSGLKWALLTTSIAARSVDPTSHWPAALEQKKARTQGETFRLDQSRVPTPSSPLGSVRYKWLFRIQHFTYLSHVSFHWLYSHGKTLSSDFPMPWERLLQMPNKGIWKKISNCIFSSMLLSSVQVTFNSHSNLLPQNILSTFFRCMI